MKIIYSSSFERAYKKLPSAVKTSAEKAEQVFRQDPFDPRLKTHKLKGRLKDFWSFSITQKYRIVFELGKEGIVYFHLVGDHSIYQ